MKNNTPKKKPSNIISIEKPKQRGRMPPASKIYPSRKKAQRRDKKELE